MRPFIIDPLFRALNVLPGVGPRNLKRFEKLTGGEKILDLLWHLPIDLIDRRSTPKIVDAPIGQVATFKVTVQKHFKAPKRSLPYRVWCSDETGSLNLVFFNARADWLLQQLPEGAEKIVSGKVEKFNDTLQIVHPDAIGNIDELERIAVYEPLYPLTEGLTNKTLRKALDAATKFIPELPEWLDATLLKRESWGDWKKSLLELHQPETPQAVFPEYPARKKTGL